MTRNKYIVFTMDVEEFSDTECVANTSLEFDLDVFDGFDEYMRILDKYDIKSTLFTVGSLAPKIVDRLTASISKGHRLALHNYKHISPLDVTEETFREELKTAKSTISELLGTEIEGFRAPCFRLDINRLNILKELGFKYDSSYLNFPRARQTVPLDLSNFDEISKGIYYDGSFFEFEMSKQKIFGRPYPISGGGYVRLYNWPFIKGVIRHYLKNNDYYVFYLHPFELTRQKIPYIKELKSYDKYYLRNGIKKYGKHIEQIIKLAKKLGYTFITFEELAAVLEQSNQTK